MLKQLPGRPWNTASTHNLEPPRPVTLHHYYIANRGTEYFLDQNMPQETSRPASPEGMTERTKELLAEEQMEEMLLGKRLWLVAKLRLG